jgi:hypothetical protein
MSTLERLRASDPARDLEPTPPDELLRAIVATPRRPRRRRAALLLAPVTGAAAVAALLLAPTGSTDLAARAYAQTAPANDSILYVRTTMRQRMVVRGRTERDETSRRERWQQGARWHSILHHQGEVYEEVRGADGVLHLPDGTTARREDGGDAQDYIDRSEPGFLTNFRRAYESGRLDESGDARFAGRAAKRYVVVDRYGGRSEYFLDAETGAPLGSSQRMVMFAPKIGPDRRPAVGKPNGYLFLTETVEALQQLPPTPENLAKLSGPTSAPAARPGQPG